MAAIDRTFAQQLATSQQKSLFTDTGPDTDPDLSNPDAYKAMRDKAYVSAMDHQKALNLEQVLKGNPGLSPQGGYVALVSGLPADSPLYQQLQDIDTKNTQQKAAAAAQQKAQQQAKSSADSSGGGFWGGVGDVLGGIGSGVKGTVRYGTAALSTFGQVDKNLLTYGISKIDGHGSSAGGILSNTDLGAAVLTKLQTGKWDTGSGWIMGGGTKAIEEQAAKSLDQHPGYNNPRTNGVGTLGGDLANWMGLDMNAQHGGVSAAGGDVVSGAVDFASNLLDPTLYIPLLGEAKGGLEATKAAASSLKAGEGLDAARAAAGDARVAAKAGKAGLVAKAVPEARAQMIARDAAKAFDEQVAKVTHKNELAQSLFDKGTADITSYHQKAQALQESMRPQLEALFEDHATKSTTYSTLAAQASAQDSMLTAEQLREAGFTNKNQIARFIAAHEEIPAQREALLAERARLTGEAKPPVEATDAAAAHGAEGEQQVAQEQVGAQEATQETPATPAPEGEAAPAADATTTEAEATGNTDASRRVAQIDRQLAALEEKAKVALDSLPHQTRVFLNQAKIAAESAGAKYENKIDDLTLAMDQARNDMVTTKAETEAAIAKAQADADQAHRMSLRIAQGVAEANGWTADLPALTETADVRKFLEAKMGVFAKADGTKMVDLDRAFDAVFNDKATEVFDAIADWHDPYTLWRLSGGKFGVTLSNALAEAKTPADVKALLTDALGKGELREDVGSIKRLRDHIEKTGPVSADQAASEIYKSMGLPARALRWGHDVATRLVPWAYDMHIEDADGMLRGSDDFLRYIWPKGGKEYADFAQKWLGKMMGAGTGVERANVFWDMNYALSERIMAEEGIDPVSALGKKVRETFTAEKSAWNDMRSFNADVRASDLGTQPIIINGVDMGNMNYAALESQMADRVHFPDPVEARRAMRNAKALNESGLRDAKDLADSVLQRHWRSLLMVFRGNFILRNFVDGGVRMFLGGYANPLTSPLTIAAMAATSRDSRLAKVLQGIAPAREDALGNAFAKRASENDDIAIRDAFQEWAHDQHSLVDPGAAKKWEYLGYRTVERGQPQFTEALARTIQSWWHDELPRDVMRVLYQKRASEAIRSYAGTVEGLTNPQEQLISYYMNTKAGQRYLSKMAQGSDNMKQLLATGEEGLRQFLFADQPWSMATRIRNATGNLSEEIMQPLFDKKFNLHSEGVGSPISDTQSHANTKALADLLHEHFGKDIKSGDFPVLRAEAPVYVASKTTPASRTGARVQNMMDAFFRFNARGEKAVLTQPLYQMSYWEKMADLIPALNESEQERLLTQARNVLPKTSSWSRKTLRDIERNTRLGHAPAGQINNMTVEDLHDLANEYAKEHVKDTIYHAGQAKQVAYAARLASPFGQAWANTLIKWSKLAAGNPTKVYRAEMLYKHATQPGSGSIYGLLGEPYVPGQGFLYKDPTTGKVTMNLPLVGKGMSALGWALSGGQRPYNPTQATSPLSSFNVAFNQTILPGLGPVIQAPFDAVSGTNPYQKLPDWFKNWVAPFQDSTGGNQGFVESHMPTNIKAFLAYIGQGSFQSSTVKYIRPMMGQLYAENPAKYSDPTTGMITDDGRKQLIDDATHAAQSFTLSRQVLSNIDAGSLNPDFFIKTAGTQGVTATALSQELNAKSSELGNYDDALAYMMDKYGPSIFVALVSAKNGANYADAGAWDFTKNHLDDAQKYPNVVPLLFADGEYSDTYQRYLNDHTLGGVAKTPDEIINQANGLLEQAQKAEVNRKLVNGQITAKDATAQRSAITAQFNGHTGLVDYNARSKKIDELQSAVTNSPAIASTQAGTAAQEYLEIRTEALKRLEAANGKAPSNSNPFGSKAAAPLKDYLYTQGEDLAKQYPDFQILWTRVLKGEVD